MGLGTDAEVSDGARHCTMGPQVGTLLKIVAPFVPLQAEQLVASHTPQVAFNLGLREEVLVEKCLGEGGRDSR